MGQQDGQAPAPRSSILMRGDGGEKSKKSERLFHSYGSNAMKVNREAGLGDHGRLHKMVRRRPL